MIKTTGLKFGDHMIRGFSMAAVNLVIQACEAPLTGEEVGTHRVKPNKSELESLELFITHKYLTNKIF